MTAVTDPPYSGGYTRYIGSAPISKGWVSNPRPVFPQANALNCPVPTWKHYIPYPRSQFRVKKEDDMATLEVGYAAAICLKPDTAPSRCYVGQVDDVDEHGVRLSLMDWMIGRPVGWDFFVPWENVDSVLVATPDHDVESFGEAAAEFQVRCEHIAEGPEAIEEAIKAYRELRAGAMRD